MGRISNYQEDSVVGPKDKVVGSELIGYNSGGAPYYKTRNFTMFDIQTFVMGGSFEFAAPITIQTTSAGNKKWVHDDITRTSNTSSNALVHSGPATTFTAINSIVTDAKGHITLTNLATYTLPDYKFNIAADSNPGSDDAVIDINSSSFDTLNVLGGVVLTSKITADDTITVDHDNITRSDSATLTPSTLTYGTANTGKFTAVTTVTTTLQGHVTDVQSTQFTLPEIYTFDVKGDNTGANQTIANGNTLIIAGTAPISTLSSDTDTVTITHDDASTLNVTNITSITNTGFGGTFTVMGSVGRDDQGHLTSARPVTVTIPNTLFSASSLQNNSETGGSIGLVPKPSSTDTTKFLRGDGDWVTIPAAYSLPLAASSTRGGVKIGYAANATNYPVELTQEKMYVNVPTYSAAVSNAAGTTGLMPGAAAGEQNFLMTGSGDWQNFTFTISGKQYNNAGASIVGIAMSGGGTSFGIQHADTNSGNQLAVSNTGRNVIQSITIDPYGHVTSMASADMSYASSDFNHDDLTGFVANEHINWTTDQGNTNIHSGNYTNTTYSEATSSSEGLMSIAHHDKLDGIEDNATADQTAAQLRTAIGTGNGNLVPAAGTAGHFLKHDGTFGLPSYTTNTDTNTTYSAGAGIDLSGTTFSLTQTTLTGNGFFKIPFMSSNVINVDSSASSFSYNPSSNVFSVGQISIGTTSTLTSRSIYSQSSGSNYFEIANTSTSNGGRLIFGCTTSGFNGIYSRNHNNSAGREFRLIQLSNTVITVATSGNTTVNGTVTADNFIVTSDKRLKSEIEPIKEGLEVIKQFTSYNYIKGGKKESGFIAQEVQQVLPHTVYEDKEGMLSMSDRGVLAHMHKAILELEERLTAIEEKLN